MPTQSWCNTFAATLIGRLRTDHSTISIEWIEDSESHIRILDTIQNFNWSVTIRVVPLETNKIQVIVTIQFTDTALSGYRLEFSYDITDAQLGENVVENINTILQYYVRQERTQGPRSLRYGSAWHALNRLVDVLL